MKFSLFLESINNKLIEIEPFIVASQNHQEDAMLIFSDWLTDNGFQPQGEILQFLIRNHRYLLDKSVKNNVLRTINDFVRQARTLSDNIGFGDLVDFRINPVYSSWVSESENTSLYRSENGYCVETYDGNDIKTITYTPAKIVEIFPNLVEPLTLQVICYILDKEYWSVNQNSISLNYARRHDYSEIKTMLGSVKDRVANGSSLDDIANRLAAIKDPELKKQIKDLVQELIEDAYSNNVLNALVYLNSRLK